MKHSELETALIAALERTTDLLCSITDVRSDLREFQDAYVRQARKALEQAKTSTIRAKKAAAPRAGEKITPARAASLRQLNAKLCGCMLCVWALNPATTFAQGAIRALETERRNATGDWPKHKDWAALKSEGLAE